jgi:hypothetical protein
VEYPQLVEQVAEVENNHGWIARVTRHVALAACKEDLSDRVSSSYFFHLTGSINLKYPYRPRVKRKGSP